MGRLIDADKLNRKDVNCANVPMNFIDTAPTVEAIPRADYEARLKADMAAMLTDLQLEIAELPAHVVTNKGSIIRMEIAPSAEDVYEVIQQKIDSLKGADSDSKKY